MTGPILNWKGGAPATFLLKGGHAVDRRQGIERIADIHVADGDIVSITAPGEHRISPDVPVIDCEGMFILPAFTDPHVHLRTPGQEHKEDIATGTMAAAAGGYCQIIAMPNTRPPIDNAEILRGVLARCATEALIPTGQMGGITKGLSGSELTEMATMVEAGASGFTDDGMPVADASVLRRALRYQALTGAVIALHEEDPSLSMGAPLNEGLVSARRGLKGQTSLAESTMIERDCALAEVEGARIHIQHVSATRSIEAIRRAKARGVKVSAEASPHHLLLTEEACDSLDTRTKMNPPLRLEEDRLALVDALADGTIDCVATDHAPHSPDEKAEPFADAPFGVTGLETSFAMLHQELVVPGAIGLGRLVECMTSGCGYFGAPVPSLEVGMQANMTVFDPKRSWVAGAEGWHSRSSNSCFANRAITGRVAMTVAAGVVVHRLPGSLGAGS